MERPEDRIRQLMRRYGITPAQDGRRVISDVQSRRSKLAHRMRKYRRLAGFMPPRLRYDSVRKAAGVCPAAGGRIPPRVTPDHMRRRGATLLAIPLADIKRHRQPNERRMIRGLRYLAAARWLEGDTADLTDL